MKITITTWYELETREGEYRRFKAEVESNYTGAAALQVILDEHEAKQGSIERKLINEHE